MTKYSPSVQQAMLVELEDGPHKGRTLAWLANNDYPHLYELSQSGDRDSYVGAGVLVVFDHVTSLRNRHRAEDALHVSEQPTTEQKDDTRARLDEAWQPYIDSGHVGDASGEQEHVWKARARPGAAGQRFEAPPPEVKGIEVGDIFGEEEQARMWEAHARTQTAAARRPETAARDEQRVFSTVLFVFALAAIIIASDTMSWKMLSASDPLRGESASIKMGLTEASICKNEHCRTWSYASALGSSDGASAREYALVGVGYILKYGGMFLSMILLPLAVMCLWKPRKLHQETGESSLLGSTGMGIVIACSTYLALVVGFHLLVGQTAVTLNTEIGFSTYFGFAGGVLALLGAWLSWSIVSRWTYRW